MSEGCWPTEDQTLLLQAALAPPDMARRSLSLWRTRVSLASLDRGSIRLLPLLHHRLLADGVDDDPLLPALKQRLDESQARLTILLAMTVDAARMLRDAGIESLTLKGAAIAARGIVPFGVRPMDDSDLLVPDSQALAARDVLIRGGWTARGELDEEAVSIRHAISFRHVSGRSLDLHWHVLSECCHPDADKSFWEAAEPAVLNGTPTLTLCTADMVLHACVHGVLWSTVPPVRWAGDAMTIIRATPAFDWPRLVDEAERRVLSLPMWQTMRYLRDTLDAPVPGWVFDRLARARAPRWARAEYRVKMQPRTPTRQLQYHWYQHRRNNDSNLLFDAIRFPRYLQRRLRTR